MIVIVNATEIIKRAWSIRFLALLIILELGGVFLSVHGVFSNNEKIALYFQIAGALLGIAAFISRLTYQKGLSHDK